MKSSTSIKTKMAEYLTEQKMLVEKTLYHGTITHNIPSIEENGLMPTIGDFVKNMYSGAVDGDVMDYLEEMLYATDKKQIDKARTAIIYQIANKLGKNYHSVTNKDFEMYGALAVLKNGDEYFDFHSEEDMEHGRAPLGVETGDYYTQDEVSPDYILTGKKLTSFFRKFGLYPIKDEVNEGRKVEVDDIKKKAFTILSNKTEYLIAKVLYDEGIKTQLEFREWLKTTDKVIPQALIVAVENAFRDFEINFSNPDNIPNIFKLNQ